MAVLQIILLRSCRLLYELSCLMLTLALALQAVFHYFFLGSHFCAFLICLAIWVPWWHIHSVSLKSSAWPILWAVTCRGGSRGRSAMMERFVRLLGSIALLQLEGRNSFFWKRRGRSWHLINMQDMWPLWPQPEGAAGMSWYGKRCPVGTLRSSVIRLTLWKPTAMSVIYVTAPQAGHQVTSRFHCLLRALQRQWLGMFNCRQPWLLFGDWFSFS